MAIFNVEVLARNYQSWLLVNTLRPVSISVIDSNGVKSVHIDRYLADYYKKLI